MRPRKWLNEAERLAAYRAKRTDSSRTVSKRTVKPIEAVTPKPTDPDAKTPQWKLDAQEYMKTGRLLPAVVPTPGFVKFVDQPHVPHGPKDVPWLGAGRGVVREFKGKRYVLVARHRGPLDLEALEHGVVTEGDFVARLDQRCEHKRLGWACHEC